MMRSMDRLFDLLPVVYRQRDAEKGWPLRALLQVIGEQVDIVEDDIGELYENWFIETCQDWVVPYIGDLVGYRLVHEAGEPGAGIDPEGRRLNRILIPRREVAKTIGYRRRKGTLALLEQLANDVAGWPARAVEFYRLLALATHVNFVHSRRGRTVDLRDGGALDRLGGPFEVLAHTVDVRRIRSNHTPGRHNIPTVGVFVWRLKAFPVTDMPADCVEDIGPHCFTFSVLGNDTPLYTRPVRESDPTDIAGPLNVPAPIRRRALAADRDAYYGRERSFVIRVGRDSFVPGSRIVVADLDGWHYRPLPGTVAVDPERGRIAFPPRHAPKEGVWVTYHYGFSAEMGGGEYSRPLPQLPGSRPPYRVGGEAEYKKIGDALAAWGKDKPPRAVVEVVDQGVYVEPLSIELGANQALELRAANRLRPVLRLLDFQTDRPDALSVKGAEKSRFTLDGFLVTGRGVQLTGRLARFTLRHCTLVPGWRLRHDCEPDRPAEPSLEIETAEVCVNIEHSILGSIQVNLDEVRGEPIRLCLSDSILDATSNEREALGTPGCPVAHALVTLRRTTVLGQLQAHAIQLAENGILAGRVTVARRQIGCVRFCWVEPGSRTPRRYECQPDLVRAAAAAELHGAPPAEIKSAQDRETARARPRFNSVRYGTPAYCQLADDCAEEITRGADDESEMGAFHDLFQPQRQANLTARLDEYTPAGMEGGVIHAS